MKLFRVLSPEETSEMQEWARKNYAPLSDIRGIWHPAVQAECVRMNEEFDNLEESLGLPRGSFHREE